MKGPLTGNGEKLSSIQAEIGQAINSAVAYFHSIFSATSYRPVCPQTWGIFAPLSVQYEDVISESPHTAASLPIMENLSGKRLTPISKFLPVMATGKIPLRGY